MSNVVPFQPDRRRRARGEGPSLPGEIVFFTGVRYVRIQDADEASGTATLPATAARAGGAPVVERLLA